MEHSPSGSPSVVAGAVRQTLTQSRVGLLLLVGLVLCSATSYAKDKRPEKNTEKKASQKIEFESSVRLRRGSATLGKGHQYESNRPETPTARTKKIDSKVVWAHKRSVARPKKVTPANAYQRAFASLALRAAAISPHEGGRAEVTFIVGENGQPKQPAVFGMSLTLDKALTQHLSTLAFPVEHAGQFYSSKLSITAQPVKTPAKKTRRSKKRARRHRK